MCGDRTGDPWCSTDSNFSTNAGGLRHRGPRRERPEEHDSAPVPTGKTALTIRPPKAGYLHAAHLTPSAWLVAFVAGGGGNPIIGSSLRPADDVLHCRISLLGNLRLTAEGDTRCRRGARQRRLRMSRRLTVQQPVDPFLMVRDVLQPPGASTLLEGQLRGFPHPRLPDVRLPQENDNHNWLSLGALAAVPLPFMRTRHSRSGPGASLPGPTYCPAGLLFTLPHPACPGTPGPAYGNPCPGSPAAVEQPVISDLLPENLSLGPASRVLLDVSLRRPMSVPQRPSGGAPVVGLRRRPPAARWVKGAMPRLSR